MVNHSFSLPDNMDEWVAHQKEGVSKYVQRLIQEDMDKSLRLINIQNIHQRHTLGMGLISIIFGSGFTGIGVVLTNFSFFPSAFFASIGIVSMLYGLLTLYDYLTIRKLSKEAC